MVSFRNFITSLVVRYYTLFIIYFLYINLYIYNLLFTLYHFFFFLRIRQIKKPKRDFPCRQSGGDASATNSGRVTASSPANAKIARLVFPVFSRSSFLFLPSPPFLRRYKITDWLCNYVGT